MESMYNNLNKIKGVLSMAKKIGRMFGLRRGGKYYHVLDASVINSQWQKRYGNTFMPSHVLLIFVRYHLPGTIHPNVGKKEKNNVSFGTVQCYVYRCLVYTLI